MHRLFESSAEIDDDVECTLGNTMELEEAGSTGGLNRDTNFDVDQVDALVLSCFDPICLKHV